MWEIIVLFLKRQKKITSQSTKFVAAWARPVMVDARPTW
jgi:hypothetical protein